MIHIINMPSFKLGKNVKCSRLRKCAVCGLQRSANMSMHRLPKNEETRKLWFEAIGKEVASSSVICSNHFKQSDFRTTMNRKVLNHHAIPSQFNGQQFNSNSITQDQIMSQNELSFDSISSDEQMEETSSENQLSDQIIEDNNSQEEEQCYIYYLDEEQNVSVLESSVCHDLVEDIDNKSSKSSEIPSPSNLEIGQENSSSNMYIDMAQSIDDQCTEEKSLEVSKSQYKTVLQNLSLEPFIGLNSSHFTTKHAWKTFCDIISEYRGQVYDLQDNNNILQTKINRLKELLNIQINKI